MAWNIFARALCHFLLDNMYFGHGRARLQDSTLELCCFPNHSIKFLVFDCLLKLRLSLGPKVCNKPFNKVSCVRLSAEAAIVPRSKARDLPNLTW